MIKSIIVEDDPNYSKSLIELLNSVDEPIEVLATCSNIREAQIAIDKYRPELLFLDIELEGEETGFDLLRRFEKLDFAVIFTTQYNNTSNAINAIRLCALDFLPKPILQKELCDSLKRFIENKKTGIERVRTLKMNLELERSEAKIIWVSDNDKSIRVKSENILYAQSENTTTFFFLIKEVHGKTKLTSTVSIGKWEEILERHGFCRIHNRYLVNLDHVDEYARFDSTVRMSNEEVLSVSKTRKEALLKRLGLTKFH